MSDEYEKERSDDGQDVEDVEAELVSKDSSVPVTKSMRLQLIHLASGFAIIFLAYNVVQSFIVKLFPDIGFLAFALVYGGFGIGSLFAPALASGLGFMNVIRIGAFTFAAYVLALTLGFKPLILLLAPLNGLGSGFLWVGQGLWLTELATGTGQIGALTGLFFSIVMLNGVAGNSVALASLLFGASESAMMWIMFGCIVVGFLVTSAVGNPKRPSTSLNDDVAQIEKPSSSVSQRFRAFLEKMDLAGRLARIFELLKKRDVQLALTYIASQGMCVMVTFGGLPQMAELVTRAANPGASSSELVAQTSITIVSNFLVYSIVGAICGFIFGKVYDRFGWMPIVVTNTLAVAINFSLLMVIRSNSHLGMLLFVNSFLFGVTDNSNNSAINMTLSRDYPKYPEIFALYRFFFCFGVVLFAVMSLFMSFYLMLIPTLAVQVVGHALFHYRSIAMNKK